MSETPRATEILKAFGFVPDAPYYEPKHRRRGRLVDAAVNILGMGGTIADDWWDRTSGERDDDRVEHKDCLPFIVAYQHAQRELGFKVTQAPVEAITSIYPLYVGHPDQIWQYYGDALVDIKTGAEPSRDSLTERYHRYQLGLYYPPVSANLGRFLRRYNLYLTNDGKYRLVERKDRRDVTEALILAQAWHLVHGRNGK